MSTPATCGQPQSVEDAVPELGQRVLCIEPDGWIIIAPYDVDTWTLKSKKPGFVDEQAEEPGKVNATHWMPLPKPPQG